MKRFGCSIMLVILMAGLLVVSGCETQAQNKALIGGAVGAGAGQLIGRNTTGTLIGAGVGAGAGYLWGRSQDKKAEERSAESAPQGSYTDGTSTSGTTMTMWVNNANGTRTEIKLTRNPDGSYTGPGGKVYSSLPTQEQLQADYGS
ncbi:MAG: YMGG-like glycine zipper-containing protein [Planctomycetaceae bacterium]|nr:YMGG-like glycine zipper-containing protein [Planctomycetaceae bacterium]